MVSKEMARCIAKISGDGYLYHRYIRYSNKCEILRKEFKSDILSEFGKVILTEGVGNSGTPFVQVNRKFVVQKFLEFLSSFKSNDIFIPKIIKQNKKILRPYLRALYDDEGCVALRLFIKGKEWKRNITITSNSLRLLEEIKISLMYLFSIFSNKIIRSRPKSDYDKSYILSITGKHNIIKFKEDIRFKHPDKIRKLRLMIQSYDATSKNKEAFEKLKGEIYRSH